MKKKYEFNTQQPKQSVSPPTAFPLLPGDPGITLTNAIAFNNLQKPLFEKPK